MKHKIHLIYLATLLACCKSSLHNNAEQKTADTTKRVNDTSHAALPVIQAQQVAFDTDSVAIGDSVLPHLNLTLLEITEKEFTKYEKAYKRTCELDSGGFVKGYGLTLNTHCDEICETWLLENGSERKMKLPSGYDGGIAGLTLSPLCKQFITYSSYDGPGYAAYYSDRAEIIGYALVNAKGLDAVKPAFNYFTKDWSITNLVWIDEYTIALKVYEGERNDDSKVTYKYLKAALKN